MPVQKDWTAADGFAKKDWTDAVWLYQKKDGGGWLCKKVWTDEKENGHGTTVKSLGDGRVQKKGRMRMVVQKKNGGLRVVS